VEQLRQAKAILADANLLEIRESFKAIDQALLKALQEQALLEAALAIADSDGSDPTAALMQLNAEWGRLCEKAQPLEKAARDRLMILLSLLRTPGVALPIDNSEQLHDEAAELIHFFRNLSAAFPPLLMLRKEFAKVQSLLPHRMPGCSEFVDVAIERQAGQMSALIEKVHNGLGAVAYPFSHIKTNISVVEYAKAKEYDPDPVRMICKETESHLQMLFALYFKSLGRLIVIASQVENALDKVQEPAPAVNSAPSRPVVRIVNRKPS